MDTAENNSSGEGTFKLGKACELPDAAVEFKAPEENYGNNGEGGCELQP